MSSRTAALDTLLPPGYRSRGFRDEDREPIVAQRNAELPEVEHQSAAEWREWERTTPDDTRVRVVVETAAGEIAGLLDVRNGGAFRAPDGSARGSVRVERSHRRRGIGSALLSAFEDEARRLAAPKIYSSVSARDPEDLEWATRHGYREIGRRIEAVIELSRFDPVRWEDRVHRTRASGIRFATLAQLKNGKDDAAFEALLHEIYDVEAEAWEDVPIASPMSHWAFDVFRRMLLERGPTDLHVLALDGDRIVGLTTSFGGPTQPRAGTAMTGTLRAYRGRGIAFALKVDVLTRAKAAGLRWMLTTNDEPNKAMRHINTTLGYDPLPAWIEVEKSL